jgi:hypothetical protein
MHTASNSWPHPSSLDAVIAAPKHHRILLENDHVRVLEVRIPAGDTVPLHTHRWPSVLHLIQWADFVRRDENGNQLTDTRTLPPGAKAPGITWAEPFTPHTDENVDSVDLLGIAVESKS